MKIDIEIDIKQAVRDVDKVRTDINSILGRAVKAGADIIVAEAKGNTKGRIAAGIIGRITWDKNKSKAFAGAFMDPGVSEFVHVTKDGKRYYIPAAVEYGHRPPGGDKTISKMYLRGKKAGQSRIVKNKAAKPVRFMQKAYSRKKKIVEALVLSRIEEALRKHEN